MKAELDEKLRSMELELAASRERSESLEFLKTSLEERLSSSQSQNVQLSQAAQKQINSLQAARQQEVQELSKHCESAKALCQPSLLNSLHTSDHSTLGRLDNERCNALRAKANAEEHLARESAAWQVGRAAASCLRDGVSHHILPR